MSELKPRQFFETNAKISSQMIAFWQRIKEIFYRREIEIFWDAAEKDTYGIREVYRSRVAILSGGVKWRLYSQTKKGNAIHLTKRQMQKLLLDAAGFVKDRK